MSTLPRAVQAQRQHALAQLLRGRKADPFTLFMLRVLWPVEVQP